MNLNVNIDHVATLRQARGVTEPDPVSAALIAELAGATGIVAHLREDRRHVQDRDIRILRETVQTRLDLEMAATDEIIAIALDIKPNLVTIVPEKRMELTTEGGLNVSANKERFRKLCDNMHSRDIEVSFFIEPDEEQINAVCEVGGDMVELHTGDYANAVHQNIINIEIHKIQQAANLAKSMGLSVAGGHGLNYVNVVPIAKIHSIRELSIGHSIIARSVYVGIERAVKEMLAIMHKSAMDELINRNVK